MPHGMAEYRAVDGRVRPPMFFTAEKAFVFAACGRQRAAGQAFLST